MNQITQKIIFSTARYFKYMHNLCPGLVELPKK